MPRYGSALYCIPIISNGTSSIPVVFVWLNLSLRPSCSSISERRDTRSPRSSSAAPRAAKSPKNESSTARHAYPCIISANVFVGVMQTPMTNYRAEFKLLDAYPATCNPPLSTLRSASLALSNCPGPISYDHRHAWLKLPSRINHHMPRYSYHRSKQSPPKRHGPMPVC